VHSPAAHPPPPVSNVSARFALLSSTLASRRSSIAESRTAWSAASSSADRRCDCGRPWIPQTPIGKGHLKLLDVDLLRPFVVKMTRVERQPVYDSL